MSYIPPFTLNNKIVSLVASISEQLGRLSASYNKKQLLLQRKVNRVRSIQGALAIEANPLSAEQISAIVAGQEVIAPEREVIEASNALSVYEQLDSFQFDDEKALLLAHKNLMQGLIESAGQYHATGVELIKNSEARHRAQPTDLVARLMADLFTWLDPNNKEASDVHPLIKSCVFHYEIEFIHPFIEGNGRIGRLWQMLILKQYHDAFTYLPVESLIATHQTEYYQAIAASTKKSNSAPFIEFMLTMIDKALHLSRERLAGYASNQASNQARNQASRQATPQAKAQAKPQDTQQVSHQDAPQDGHQVNHQDSRQVNRQVSRQDSRQVTPQDSCQESPQDNPQVSEQVTALLRVMLSEQEQNKISRFKRETLQKLLGLSDKKSFTQRYLKPALKDDLVEMTIPEKPTSRLQQYRLTALGMTTE